MGKSVTGRLRVSLSSSAIVEGKIKGNSYRKAINSPGGQAEQLVPISKGGDR
jgi:hypothetical protein